jgi:hypothetical protein
MFQVKTSPHFCISAKEEQGGYCGAPAWLESVLSETRGLFQVHLPNVLKLRRKHFDAPEIVKHFNF